MGTSCKAAPTPHVAGGRGAATTSYSLKAMINLLILVVIHNAPITILVIYPIYSYRDLSAVNK